MLGAESAGAMVPFVPEANQPAAFYTAVSAYEARQGYYLLEGKVGRLEHEVDRLEAALLVFTVLVGSAAAALCLLAARDFMGKLARPRENDSAWVETQVTQSGIGAR
jgi:hypothetical protein